MCSLSIMTQFDPTADEELDVIRHDNVPPCPCRRFACRRHLRHPRERRGPPWGVPAARHQGAPAAGMAPSAGATTKNLNSLKPQIPKHAVVSPGGCDLCCLQQILFFATPDMCPECGAGGPSRITAGRQPDTAAVKLCAGPSAAAVWHPRRHLAAGVWLWMHLSGLYPNEWCSRYALTRSGMWHCMHLF